MPTKIREKRHIECGGHSVPPYAEAYKLPWNLLARRSLFGEGGTPET